jgi:hypothetical protein
MDDITTLLLVLGASALAIALLVVLNLVIGGWSPARIKSAQEAAQAMETGVFGFKAASPVGLDATGKGALVREHEDARLGLALTMGDRITVRALRPGELRSVARDGARLSLALNDYTLPSAELRFADADEARSWEEIAGAFTAPASDREPPHA